MAYTHSAVVKEVNEGTRPTRPTSMSNIGLVVYSADADETVFPIGLSIHPGGIAQKLAKAGTDLLREALDIISDQVDATIVIARVAKPAAPATVPTLQQTKDAINLFRVAESATGIEPNILGVHLPSNASTTDVAGINNELLAVAQELDAFCYITPDATKIDAATISDLLTYRDNYGQREGMLVENRLDIAVNTGKKSIPPIPFMLGLRAKIDEEVGWHACVSSNVLNGVIGISKPRSFKLGSANSEVNKLNAKEITTFIRYGSGFKPYGCRTLAPRGDFFAFESATRTAQYLKKTQQKLLQTTIDKPMTPSYLKHRLEELNSHLRSLVNDGKLYGGVAWIENADNSKERLKDGQYYLNMDYTPVPPAEQPHLYQRITDRYLINIAEQVAAA